MKRTWGLLALVLSAALPLAAPAQTQTSEELSERIRQQIAASEMKTTEAVERGTTELKEVLTGIDQKLDGIGTRIGSVEERVTALEAQKTAEPLLTAPEVETKAAVAPFDPKLVLHFWATRPCKPGELAEKEIVKNLAWEGWRSGEDYVVIRSDEGDCPSFTYDGKPFATEGFTSWTAFRKELYAAMGVPLPAQASHVTSQAVRTTFTPSAGPVTTGTVLGGSTGIVLNPGERLIAVDGRPVDASIFSGAVPMDEIGRQLYSEQYRPRASIPPARRQWYQNGHSATAAHLRSHGIDPTGMSQAEMDRAHSHAHEGTWNPAWSGSGGYAYSAPVRARSGRTYRVQNTGLFGGFFRNMSGGCPSGMCPN